MKKFLQIILVLILFFNIFCLPVIVKAQNYGTEVAAGKAGLTTGTDIQTVLGTVIGAALSLVAVIFFILMVYGGFIWMMARGNEENTKKALNTITAAIIGLIIVLAAYAITNFIFNSFAETKKEVVCFSDTDCKNEVNKVCNVTGHICVQCVKDSNCGGASTCYLTTFTCTEEVECKTNPDCVTTKGPGYVCSTASKKCYKPGCTTDAECPSDMHKCSGAGICVICLANTDCPINMPVCSTTISSCVVSP